MAYENPATLVSTDWLARHIEGPDIRVIDGSWHLPNSGRNAKAEYKKCHIPGARFFDIDEISDQNNPLPHMAPPPELFLSRMMAMGIGDGHQVVVYDSVGLFSAARVWWLFRLMGHSDVAVLDGGLPRWLAEGRPVEDEPPAMTRRHLTARYQGNLVSSLDEVKRAAETGDARIVDARPPDRYQGKAAEPRPGLRAGHMPGALNVPHSSLLNPDGTFKSSSQIADIIRSAGVSASDHVITSCGSGVTASVVSLALEVIGHRSHSLYDGSWSEWGARDDLPVATA